MQALLNHICCGLRTFLRHPVIPQQTTSDTVSTTNKAFCCIPQTQATPGCDNAYAVSDKPCQTRAGIVQQLNSQAETNAPMLVADDAYTVRCISINTIWLNIWHNFVKHLFMQAGKLACTTSQAANVKESLRLAARVLTDSRCTKSCT